MRRKESGHGQKVVEIEARGRFWHRGGPIGAPAEAAPRGGGAGGGAPAPPAGGTGGHPRLPPEVDDVDVQYDAFTGQPNFVATRQPGARLSRAAAPTPEAAVTPFVNSRADMWGLTPEDAAAIEVVSVSQPAPPTPTGRTARARPGAAAAEPPAFSPGTLRTVNMIQRS